MLYDIINKKQRGGELTADEWLLALSANAPIEELSALLMAVYFRGMTFRETIELTNIMANSGRKFDCFNEKNYVDLHSTGGVGDKCTLIACPIVASLGVKTPKMAGRSLGNTGGTIDKLEKSFAGIDLAPNPDKFVELVEKVGFAITEQTAEITPLDGKLYGLRSRTGTAECLPLIASSIMSKKIATGAKNIVLNVTFGNGALMKTKKEAVKLARTMKAIGEGLGRVVEVVFTSMEYPLGMAVGNRIEVYEAIEILSGRLQGDAYDVSLELAEKMLKLTGAGAKKDAIKQINNGKALEKLREFVIAQGGDFDGFSIGEKVREVDLTREKAENVAIISRAYDILYTSGGKAELREQ
ncbi:thymidine phosphorylase [Treponema sp. R6D11]